MHSTSSVYDIFPRRTRIEIELKGSITWLGRNPGVLEGAASTGFCQTLTVDLQRAVFRTPDVNALILTSATGREFLERNGVAALTSTKVRQMETSEGKIAPASILKLLRDEFSVKLLLHEGGPILFGDFVAHGCVDELFLTVAPQFAGRDIQRRPGVISGAAFLPETAPCLKVVSVKQSADHLYLRYTLTERLPRPR
jgi:riboflavin biosynthesis pyrimidine reductase